jgi:hypothetical protein
VVLPKLPDVTQPTGHPAPGLHSAEWWFYLGLGVVFLLMLLVAGLESEQLGAGKTGAPLGRRTARSSLLPGASHADLLVTTAALSLAAAAIHVSVIREHFEESTLFGALFVVAAVAQTAWALLVLRRPSRPLFALGAALNGGIVAVWLLSRTTGVPLGPDPWAPEPVQPIDLVATLCEVGIVAFAVALARASVGSRPVRAREVTNSGLVLAAMLPIAAVALVVAGGGHH